MKVCLPNSSRLNTLRTLPKIERATHTTASMRYALGVGRDRGRGERSEEQRKSEEEGGWRREEGGGRKEGGREGGREDYKNVLKQYSVAT